MGEIAMARVDFRLVHGQVGGMWLKFLSAPRVIILNDEVAADPFLGEMFQLSVPEGIKIDIHKLEDGVELWKKDGFGPGRYILLFKYIEEAKHAYDLGLHFDKLNLGQIPAAPDPSGAQRQRALRTVFISKPEEEMVKALVAAGVNVYSQGAPNDSPADMLAVINRL